MHKGCCANVVVVRGVCTDIVGHSLRCDCIFSMPSVQCECHESAVHNIVSAMKVSRKCRESPTRTSGNEIECHASSVAMPWSL